MNVELVNPIAILRLFARAEAEPIGHPAWAPAGSQEIAARLGAQIRAGRGAPEPTRQRDGSGRHVVWRRRRQA